MLQGKIVSLRAIEISDLEQLRIWRNNEVFRKYFREYREISQEAQLSWYQDIVAPQKEVLMFAIIDNDSKNLLGACGLCYIDWLRRSADLSIYIGHDGLYLDDKFSINSAQILIKYAFEELGLHRIWAEVYSHDIKKQNFFNTLGFNLDGRFRESHWSEGKWIDSLFYSLLAHEKDR